MNATTGNVVFGGPNANPYLPSGPLPGIANPQVVYHQWMSPTMGVDPNKGLIDAMNRLAAALEVFNSGKRKRPRTEEKRTC